MRRDEVDGEMLKSGSQDERWRSVAKRSCCRWKVLFDSAAKELRVLHNFSPRRFIGLALKVAESLMLPCCSAIQ
jgi:hypothetical protein